ncbi:MAG: D-alanine--D-alanine ligase family protein [Deltaproteobacteria bacterium]
MEEKLKIAVIFGGKSSEHDVSRVSAASVIRNLQRDKYDIITVGITKEGMWGLYDGPIECIEDGTWEESVSTSGFEVVEYLAVQADVVFPVLHGIFGEDGCIQGLLEIINKPYIGPGVAGSAIGIDKALSKIIFEHEGIPQAKYMVFKQEGITEAVYIFIGRAEERLGYPCFVKPANGGSSIGVSKVHGREEFIEAINEALKYDSKVIVEEFIDARELECSVIGNESPIASVVGEVVPSREFYDYDSKYNDETSQIIIPAAIDQRTSDKIREYAIKAFKALGCNGMSRLDFFLHKKTGEIFINEINTIPGFTKISMFPKLFEVSGIGYKELLDKLIRLAVERHFSQFNYQ